MPTIICKEAFSLNWKKNKLLIWTFIIFDAAVKNIFCFFSSTKLGVFRKQS